MKKNIIIMAAALFAANGLWAIGPQFVNESPNTVSVNGALWQDYTVAGKGAQVIVSSNVRQNVKRGNTINFETGIQDYFSVRLGQVVNKHFVPADNSSRIYDMREFKNRFSQITKVTFNSDYTLTVEGIFRGNKNKVNSEKGTLKVYCDEDQARGRAARCSYDGESNKVTDVKPGIQKQ